MDLGIRTSRLTMTVSLLALVSLVCASQPVSRRPEFNISLWNTMRELAIIGQIDMILPDVGIPVHRHRFQQTILTVHTSKYYSETPIERVFKEADSIFLSGADLARGYQNYADERRLVSLNSVWRRRIRNLALVSVRTGISGSQRLSNWPISTKSPRYGHCTLIEQAKR